MKTKYLIALVALAAAIAVPAIFTFQASAPSHAKSVELNIAGMHCAGCVVAVQKSLSSVPNVKKVRVNAARARATVVISDSTAGLPDLIRAVSQTGFRAEVVPKKKAN